MKKSGLILIVLFINLGFCISQSNWEWTEQESGTINTLRDVFFISNTTGWVVGSEGTILKTTNGGNTWNPQTSGTDQSLDAVHFIDENTGWIVGGGVTANPAPMLKTTDGGDTWSSLSYQFGATFIRDIFFVDENIGWAIRIDTIYRSVDGGETWISEDFTTTVTMSTTNNKEIFATSDTIAYVAGRNDNGTSKSMATVFDRRPQNAYLWGTDAAGEWHKDEVLQSMTFANDSVGFVGGRLGRLYRMQASGEPYYIGPWLLNYDLQRESSISSISFPTSHVGMFNTSADIDGVSIALIYHTEDQGESWTNTPDSISGLVSARLFAADENNAWIVAASGKIFKGSPQESSLINIKKDDSFSAYPNPTSGLIVLCFNSNKHLSDVKLYNAAGNLLKHKMLDNQEELEIHIEGSAGMYFIRVVDIEGNQEIVKVIKE